MRKRIKSVLIYSSIILFSFIASQVYIHFTASPYYGVDKTFAKKYELIFNTMSELSHYSSVVRDYTVALEGIQQTDFNTNKPLSIDDLKQAIHLSNAALDEILSQLENQYGDAVQPSVNNFITWKKEFDPTKAIKNSSSSRFNWIDSYNKHTGEIEKQLQKITGFYHIDSPRGAYTMSLVPMAEKQLMEHPNDPKLCQIKDYPDNRSAKERAANVVFIKLGAKYCENYYHFRSSWGKSNGINTAQLYKTANTYDILPYKDYYQKYLLPLVPKEIARLKKDPSDLKYWCDFQGNPNLFSRNPDFDVKRVAYQLYGNNLCTKYDNPIEDTSYFKTGAFCLVNINEMCEDPNGCDAIERCNPTAGISIVY